jgi:hypothetical protein
VSQVVIIFLIEQTVAPQAFLGTDANARSDQSVGVGNTNRGAVLYLTYFQADAIYRLHTGRPKIFGRLLDHRILPGVLRCRYTNCAQKMLLHSPTYILKLPLYPPRAQSRFIRPLLDTHHSHLHTVPLLFTCPEHLVFFDC